MSPRYAGVIFDLDGTLTAPGAIRFDRIRARIGMPSSGSILAWIAAHARDDTDRTRMEAMVWEEERIALERMELGAGFAALVAALEARGPSLDTAICTRNNDEALEAFDRLLRGRGYRPSAELFRVQIARSHHSPHLDRALENKPSPEPVHEIIRRWDLGEVFPPVVAHEHDPPRHEAVLFVGDDVDDCLSARRAGVQSGLIQHGERPAEDPRLSRTVDHRFDDLSQVAAELSRPLRSC